MDKIKGYLLQIAKGNRQAFDALFLLYYPKVKYFIHTLVENKEDVLDISQDVFFKLWLNRNLLTGVRHFSSYLFQISRNAVSDYYKNTSHAGERMMDDERQLYTFPDAALLEDAIDARDLEFIINTYIKTMPSQQKKVFLLSREENLNNEEIACQLSISRRTVEKHISNALKELRKFLSKN